MYYLDGIKTKSVTSIISQYKHPFDKEYWSEKKADERGAGITGEGLSTPGLTGKRAPGLAEYFSHNSASILPSSYIHLRELPNEAL